MHSHGGDVAASVAEHLDLLELAARRGAHLVVFPELSLTGYEPELVDLHRLRYGPESPQLRPLAAACRRLRMHALVGAPIAQEDPLDLPEVGVLHLDPGGRITHRYSKQLLTIGETGIFGVGKLPGLVTLRGHALAIGLCADSRPPEQPARVRDGGAEAYLLGGVFPIGAEHRIEQQMHTVTGAGLWAVLAQYCGGTGIGPACGGSGIWRPDGAIWERLDSAAGVALVELG